MPTAAPPLVFDGRIFWYTERYDPDDDRCCSCRKRIEEDSVPLMLFREVPVAGRAKPQTWLARFCERCSRAMLITSRRA